VEWLKQQKFPIYMQDQRLVPNATSLPIEELVAEFGKYFFTSSFAYMLAHGDQGWGRRDCHVRHRYGLQGRIYPAAPGGHYFMQKAAERGIQVSVPFESDLAQPPALYGYSDSTPYGRKLHVRDKEIKDRVNGMKAERDKLNHSITYLEGALEDVDYWKSIWGGVQT